MGCGIIYSQGKTPDIDEEETQMEKTYMETRKAVKELVLTVGLKGIYNYHLNELREQGHTGTNLQNAISYFKYSPATAKYRMGG